MSNLSLRGLKPSIGFRVSAFLVVKAIIAKPKHQNVGLTSQSHKFKDLTILIKTNIIISNFFGDIVDFNKMGFLKHKGMQSTF